MAGTVKASIIQHDVSNVATVFKDGAGTEIGQLIKAWITYDGANLSSKASFNVSSVSRSSTGQFTYSLTNAMSDSLYPVSASGLNGDDGSSNPYPTFTNNIVVHWGWTYSSSQFRSTHMWVNNTLHNPFWTTLVINR